MEILKYHEMGVHEGGEATLQCIGGYEKFIQDYPNSDLIPTAYYEIADHYRATGWGEYRDADINPDLLGKAKETYLKIIKDYPNTDDAKLSKQKIHEIEERLEHFDKLKKGQ